MVESSPRRMDLWEITCSSSTVKFDDESSPAAVHVADPKRAKGGEMSGQFIYYWCGPWSEAARCSLCNVQRKHQQWGLCRLGTAAHTLAAADSQQSGSELLQPSEYSLTDSAEWPAGHLAWTQRLPGSAPLPVAPACCCWLRKLMAG